MLLHVHPTKQLVQPYCLTHSKPQKIMCDPNAMTHGDVLPENLQVIRLVCLLANYKVLRMVAGERGGDAASGVACTCGFTEVALGGSNRGCSAADGVFG